jgi:2-iminobutanoate/2-iminopropanoate deaminase
LSKQPNQAISSADAPKAIGPYSSALRAGNLLFVSGQVPFDPISGEIVGGDISAATRRVLDNLGALLRAGGLDFSAVVRTTVFLADMSDFAAMNEVYATYFSAPYPARSTVQVARLPRDARIEIDAIAGYE